MPYTERLPLGFSVGRTVAFAGFLLATAADAGTGGAGCLSGVYEISVCDECGTTPKVAGLLVLFDEAIDIGALSEWDRAMFSYVHEWEASPANACFEFDHVAEDAPSFAGIHRAAITSWKWSNPGREVSVLLYRSPDAFSHATFVINGDVLAGEGRDSGFIGEHFDHPAGYYLARRVGDADPSLCFAAIERAKRRLFRLYGGSSTER